MRPLSCLAAITILLATTFVLAVKPASPPPNHRPPSSDADLKFWLANMVQYHNFTTSEITAATGLTPNQIAAAQKKFNIYPKSKPVRPKNAPLNILPYPGGRHPRIGFLDGAIRPQRETKFSVFLPHDPRQYIVLDIPEAIWSNLGLTYLAHTHIPTIFDKKKITLNRLEWTRHKSSALSITRKLPNGITFTTRVVPTSAAVHMQIKLTNGTKAKLSGLRVQNCVMLKGAPSFIDPNHLKLKRGSRLKTTIRKPYVAYPAQHGDKSHWIITAWEPCLNPWSNPPCPCLHSDPKFPDLPPGQTGVIRGILTFYKGNDIHAEFKRLDATNWHKSPFPKIN